MLLQVDHKPAYAYTGTKPIVPGQRAVMFIHGAANDHSVWALQSRYFAYHGFNVLAVDLPGHGKSGGPPLVTVEDMAGWVARVLDAAGIERGAASRPRPRKHRPVLVARRPAGWRVWASRGSA